MLFRDNAELGSEFRCPGQDAVNSDGDDDWRQDDTAGRDPLARDADVPVALTAKAGSSALGSSARTTGLCLTTHSQCAGSRQDQRRTPCASEGPRCCGALEVTSLARRSMPYRRKVAATGLSPWAKSCGAWSGSASCRRPPMRSAASWNYGRFGCGTAGGLEVVGSPCRHWVDVHATDRVMAQLDLEKAFNSVSPQKVLESHRAMIPGLRPGADRAYSQLSPLAGSGAYRVKPRSAAGSPVGPAVVRHCVASGSEPGALHCRASMPRPG